MSWIFGIIHKKTEDISVADVIDEPALFNFDNGQVELYSGGSLNTINYSVNKEKNKGFLINGLALDDSGQAKFYNKDKWERAINEGSLSEIDGHFAAVCWDENYISFKTDVLGLRDIYIKDSPDRIVFSTRIDWIAKVESASVNFSEFGSRWLLINQISHESVLAGVKRAVCGMESRINLHNFTISYAEYNWLPDAGNRKYGITEFAENLKDSLRSFPEEKINLSLSGGMDSRILLALLLGLTERDWRSHTYGDFAHPDSMLAARLAGSLNFPHEQIDEHISRDKLLQEIERYSCQTIVNNASSGYLQLYNYNHFKGSRDVFIDGGFGEIWRREFLNRLLWKDKESIYAGDAKKIFRHLRLDRSSIFNQEAVSIMREGCINQIAGMMTRMPDPKNIGIENWTDLFAVKTRLVNYYAPEQARLDGMIYNFMPFGRRSLLQNIFAVPVRLRKNGALFKTIISGACPALTKFSLIKGISSSPFYFTTLQTKILNKIKNKLNYKTYKDARTAAYLNSIKEPVMDLISSAQVKEFPAYDYAKIKLIAEEYYKGNSAWGYSLDWFISFELFRKNIYCPRKKINSSIKYRTFKSERLI